MALVKRQVGADALTMPDLPGNSKLLGKLTTLIEFLTKRTWPDGAARAPGRLWLDPSPLGFTITLIDVDQCLRIKVYAGTIDDVFAAAELVVGSESSQWEVDAYSAEQRAAKLKKKK